MSSKKDNVIDLGHSDLGIKIEIDSLVYQKVMHFVNKSKYEVSGLGKIKRDKENNTLKVVSAIILPQENTSTHTEIAGEAVAKAMYQLREEPGELKWWWHSHVNMGVFWSGEDLATITEISNGGWFAATVFNQKNEMRSAYRQVEPVTLMVDHLPTYVSAQVEDSVRKQWDEDYDKNVTNKVSIITRGSKGGRVYTPQDIADYFNYSSHNKISSIKQGQQVTLEDLFDTDDDVEDVVDSNKDNVDLFDLILLWQNKKMDNLEFAEYAEACFADADQLIHFYERGIIDEHELETLTNCIGQPIEWKEEEHGGFVAAAIDLDEENVEDGDYDMGDSDEDDEDTLSDEEAVAMDLDNGAITEEEAKRILRDAKKIDDGSDILI